MSAARHRLQRRAVVLLAWLLLAFAAVPVGLTAPARAAAALVCEANARPGAGVGRGLAAPRERAHRAAAPASASDAAARAAAPPRAAPRLLALGPLRDGRHAYLMDARLLC